MLLALRSNFRNRGAKKSSIFTEWNEARGLNTFGHRFSENNEELLELCKNGDQNALEALYRRHERPIYSLLYRMLGNHDDAEEAIADVFVKVWRSAASFRGDARFTTWLYHIAANTARDRLRSKKGQANISFEEIVKNEEAFEANGKIAENPEKAALKAAEWAATADALLHLNEEDRLLVILYHIKELSYEEISEITGISPNNLKVKLFRARQKLRQALDEMDNGCEKNDLRRNTNETDGLPSRAAKRS